MKIRLNQVYRSKRHPNICLEVIGKRKSCKWLTRILTEKPGVYAGSHSMPEFILKKEFELLDDEEKNIRV